MAGCRRVLPAGAREGHWRAADGTRIRRIDWPVQAIQTDSPAAPARRPRGSLLFVPGRADFYEKYLESFAHWHRLGWHVTSIDWRGQAGSGRYGRDGFTGHMADFSLWVADLASFWRDFQAGTAGPHVLVGHSMGGHLALRALAEGVIDPVAMVLTSPMQGLLNVALPTGLAYVVARIMAALGDPRRPAWRESERPGASFGQRNLLLTHDAGRYADEVWWRQARPELAMGPASWGWIVSALASQRRLNAPGVLEAVTTPVQILGTSADRLVSWRAEQKAARRLPHGELVGFGREASHELLRESDPVRDACLAAIDDFFDRVAG